MCSWLSRIWLFATPWTVAHQATPSLGFSRQEYWTGLPFPSPEDLPDLGIEAGSPALQANSLPSELPGKPVSLVDNHRWFQDNHGIKANPFSNQTQGYQARTKKKRSQKRHSLYKSIQGSPFENCKGRPEADGQGLSHLFQPGSCAGISWFYLV